MSDAQQPLNSLPEGHRLQEYELVRVLGVGGFGMLAERRIQFVLNQAIDGNDRIFYFIHDT